MHEGMMLDNINRLKTRCANLEKLTKEHTGDLSQALLKRANLQVQINKIVESLGGSVLDRDRVNNFEGSSPSPPSEPDIIQPLAELFKKFYFDGFKAGQYFEGNVKKRCKHDYFFEIQEIWSIMRLKCTLCGDTRYFNEESLKKLRDLLTKQH